MSQSESSGLGFSQVAACLIVGYVVYRLFFKTAGPAEARRQPVVDTRRLQEQTEVIRGMFPQVSVAAVHAELMRNGGSVEIATERILTTGFLPEPPNPTPPAARTPTSTAPATRLTPTATFSRRPTPGAGSSSSVPKSQYQDLITRYNLQSRLNETSDDNGSSQYSDKGKAPQSKYDRQLGHQKKRDDMIIAARKRLEEMDRKKTEAL